MSNESLSKKPDITADEKSESPVSESKDVPVPPQTNQIPSIVSPNVTESHATIEGGDRDDKNKRAADENSMPEGKRLNSMHDMVLSIEDCDLSSDQASISEHIVPAPVDNRQPLLPHNNNCMALIPIPTSGQLVPVALLGKSSGSQDECPGGIMQLITGTNNKVAPAANPDSVQTVGAVLMIIPKNPESVCVDLQQDEQNNSFQENQNCTSNTAGSVPVVDNLVPEPDAPLRPTQSYDSYEEVCRICHDNPSKLELISPCLCKGSMSKVHRTCLERWLGESAKNSCEICGYEYNTVRKPKYKGCRSVYQWIRHPLSVSDSRNLLFDIACFFVLTPLSLISSWLCVMGAQHYSLGEEQKRKARLLDPRTRINGMRDASNATWTSVGLLSLTGTLLAAYYIWLFVAVRYHIQIWREWQQRNFTVTIVPFEDGCMGRPPPPRATTVDQTVEANSASDNQNYGLNNNTNNNIPLLYSSGSSTRGRVYGRAARFSGNVNVPAIFSRSHFLRNAHPGYTISETTLMYQAIYGSDSDNALFNDNLLAFIADSSEDMLLENDTESSSEVIMEAMRQQQAETKETEQQCPAPNIVGRNDDNTVDIPLGTHVEVVDLTNRNVSHGQIKSQQQQDITNDNTSVPQESNPNHITIIVEDDPSKERGIV